MALNSAMHQAYLEMPINAQMMPELEGMKFWARTVHEQMYNLNPALMISLNREGKLKSYLDTQQTRLSEEARALEKEWRQKNPLPDKASVLGRASWHKHSQLWARENLISDLANSLSALAQESPQQDQQAQ